MPDPATVSLSAPLANARFTAPASVAISADVGSPSGALEVAFYQGDTLIATATSAPYRFTWSDVPAGSYMLRAKATDAGGTAIWSDDVPITVAQP